MKSLIKICSSVLLVLVWLVASQAQVDLIPADEFMKMYKSNKDLVVLDANKTSNYEENHIKGAINVSHTDLYKEGDIAGVIQSPEWLAEYFAGLGISNDTPVVVYDDGSQKYSSRVYWILKYIGAENVQILHRDMNDWRKARVPLTSQVPDLDDIEQGHFTINVKNDMVVNLDYLIENINNEDMVIIDSRTLDEYNGVASNSEGHIPTAVSLNYELLLDESGAFKSKDELMAIANEYNLSPEKELVFYCRTSVRATVAFVAFKNILGFEKVRVYDGAYLEWYANYEVE